MTFAELEQVASNAAWDHPELRAHLKNASGYAYAETPLGRLRLQHRRNTDPKRGERSCWLNSAPISRARAAELLSAS